MNNYVTGLLIKELREKKKLTQAQLADVIKVSNKTISKWETGKGLLDISLIKPLSKALGVSIMELFNGKYITNDNKGFNMLKTSIYVCPICNNVIHSIGDSLVSCCGVLLPKLEAELSNEINITITNNEYYVKINHEMSKTHYISFIAYATNDRFEMVKLYPEQNAEVSFFRRGKGIIYVYCNKDGLFSKKI